MEDDTFIEYLDLLKWTANDLEQARRLLQEGRLAFVSGDGYGKFVKPEHVQPWHDVRPNVELTSRPIDQGESK